MAKFEIRLEIVFMAIKMCLVNKTGSINVGRFDCAGKSECQKCFSANGRFCRACLKVRYGEDLDTVRKQVAAGTWLCPHCYEEEHPCEVRCKNLQEHPCSAENCAIFQMD